MISALTMATIVLSASPYETRRQWLPVAKTAAQHYKIDWVLLDAIIWEESYWNPNAVSHAGAEGLTQLMPNTAAMLRVNNSFDAGQAIWASAWYLRTLYDRFKNWRLAIAAYNAGPSRVAACDCIPFQETRIYVKKVMKRWQ